MTAFPATISSSSPPFTSTMLSVHPAELQYHQTASTPYYYQYPSHYYPMPHRQTDAQAGSVLSYANMGHHHVSKNSHQHHPQDAAVAQALEIARESPDGAQDPTVSKILEHALSQIWSRVQAAPDSYVMSRDEFAVFNFFQHRFTGNKTAVTARKRYWDHARV